MEVAGERSGRRPSGMEVRRRKKRVHARMNESSPWNAVNQAFQGDSCIFYVREKGDFCRYKFYIYLGLSINSIYNCKNALFPAYICKRAGGGQESRRQEILAENLKYESSTTGERIISI